MIGHDDDVYQATYIYNYHCGRDIYGYTCIILHIPGNWYNKGNQLLLPKIKKKTEVGSLILTPAAFIQAVIRKTPCQNHHRRA